MTFAIRHTLLGLALAAVCVAAPAMNLLQVYDAALEQDANVRAGRAALASGQERLPQARAQLLPVINANFGRNRNQLSTTSVNILGNESVSRDDYFSFTKSLLLRQPLFNLPRYYQYKQAEDLVQESVANYEREVQNLVRRRFSLGRRYRLSACAHPRYCPLRHAQSRGPRPSRCCARRT